MVLIRKLKQFGMIPKEGDNKCPKGHPMVLSYVVPKKKNVTWNYDISIKTANNLEYVELSN